MFFIFAPGALPPSYYGPAPESMKTIKKLLVYTSLTNVNYKTHFVQKTFFGCVCSGFFANMFMLARKRIPVLRGR